MSAPAQLAPEDGERQPRALVLAHEAFGWRELERDAGQMLGGLGDASRTSRRTAGSWIVDPLPVTDLRTTKWFMSQCRIAGSRSWRRCSSSKRSGRPSKMQLARHLDQGAQRHPLQRHRMATPQRVQIESVAVVRGDHGQAGEAALGRFGLPDDGQAVPRP